MKTMKYLSMLLMMVALSVCMVSCSGDDDPVEATASIIRDWSQTNSAGTVITLQFRANKTGVINYFYPNNTGDENENFEYDYIEKERSLTIIGSQLGGVYYATLTATKLILSNNSTAYEFTKK